MKAYEKVVELPFTFFHHARLWNISPKALRRPFFFGIPVLDFAPDPPRNPIEGGQPRIKVAQEPKPFSGFDQRAAVPEGHNRLGEHFSVGRRKVLRQDPGARARSTISFTI